MLCPKRTKYRRYHRFKNIEKKIATRSNTLKFAPFGLKSINSAWMTSRQIESGRRAITRFVRRGGKLWIRIYPDKPITFRPPETRMGSGKGSPDFWVAIIKSGNMLYEIAGISEVVARGAMRVASFKLPVKTKFINIGVI